MLLLTQSRPMRCRMWEDLTPNELYAQNSVYRDLVANWGKANDLPSGHKWNEMRLVKQQSVLEIKRSSAWWDDPMWMERLFWCYSRPILHRPAKGQFIQFYALEYYECQRVLSAAIQKFGYNPFSKRDENGNLVADTAPSLIIPAECIELAWDDTRGGYATNIRQGAIERASRPVSQQELDREAAIQEQVKKKMTELVDISHDRRWDTSDDR